MNAQGKYTLAENILNALVGVIVLGSCGFATLVVICCR